METLKTTLCGLQEDLSTKNGSPNANSSLQSLVLVSTMLETPILSDASLKNLCFILRRNMIYLYQVTPKPAVRYTATLFVVISDIKVKIDKVCREMWEDAQESLLSGLLDFLEQHSTSSVIVAADKRELVASVFYSPLCRELFPEEDKPNPVVKDSLLCTIFQLMSETAIFHPVNQHKLRNSDILGGKRLGLMLAQYTDFLVIEALLELIGNIIPSAKAPKRRSEFIDDVFCLVRLERGAKLLEDVSLTGWDIVSATIFDALAKSDIRYPQPFATTKIQAREVSYIVDRIYIDKSAFMASVDKNGQLDTFKVPFHTVRRIKFLASSASTTTVMVFTEASPLVGHELPTRGKDEEISIAFDLKREKVSDFVTVLGKRGLKNITEPVHRKQSKAKTGINLDLRSGRTEIPAFEAKIENITRLWQSPNETDPNRTTSPLQTILKTKNEGDESTGTSTFPTEVDGPASRISLNTAEDKPPYSISDQFLQQDATYITTEATAISDPSCDGKSNTRLQRSVETSIAINVSEEAKLNTADCGIVLNIASGTSIVGIVDQAQLMEGPGKPSLNSEKRPGLLLDELGRREINKCVEVDHNVRAQQEQSVLLLPRHIDKLPTFIDLTEDETAGTWIAKLPKEGASDDAKITRIKTARHGTVSLEKSPSLSYAEEKIPFSTKKLNCKLPKQAETEQYKGAGIMEHSDPDESKSEGRERPFVSFPLLQEPNTDVHSKLRFAGPSSSYSSTRKRSRNGNQSERQVRESHATCPIASHGTPSKRRKLDTNVHTKIIDVVNQIHEAIKDNIVQKFSGLRKDIYATQAKILEGTCEDFLTMGAKSFKHYEQLVDVANEYTTHRLGLTDALSRLLDTELDVIGGIRGIIHDHDRFSLSSRFPDMVPPAIPDSFCRNLM